MKVIFGTDPIKYPLTGIGRYSFELAKGLEKCSDISELLFLNGRHISHTLPTSTNAPSINLGLKKIIQKNWMASELYRVFMPRIKGRVLDQYKDYIYHSPNFYLPACACQTVATFHDLSVFTWPECHPKERVRYMRKELLLTLKRASILITDSEFTRQELAQYFNYPITKIFTAKLASSGIFFPRENGVITSVISKYNIKVGKYAFFTGSIEPRKNISTLLDAYERLPVELRKTIPLVISGYKGWESEKLRARFAVAEKNGWLRYLGYTSAEDLPFLFAGAKTFIFPSLYEGFGLPVLEAMASGIPVVCSNSSSLPEVVGNCALMNDPLDTEGLTSSILKSLDDDCWRKQAIERGLERAKLFSWENCAQETLNAYRMV